MSKTKVTTQYGVVIHPRDGDGIEYKFAGIVDCRLQMANRFSLYPLVEGEDPFPLEVFRTRDATVAGAAKLAILDGYMPTLTGVARNTKLPALTKVLAEYGLEPITDPVRWDDLLARRATADQRNQPSSDLQSTRSPESPPTESGPSSPDPPPPPPQSSATPG